MTFQLTLPIVCRVGPYAGGKLSKKHLVEQNLNPVQTWVCRPTSSLLTSRQDKSLARAPYLHKKSKSLRGTFILT